jgi:hypothetical protein
MFSQLPAPGTLLSAKELLILGEHVPGWAPETTEWTGILSSIGSLANTYPISVQLYSFLKYASVTKTGFSDVLNWKVPGGTYIYCQI